MTDLYLEALVAIAASFSVLMAGAWGVQRRTGNSGWVDTIWAFALGPAGVGGALWPVARQWRDRDRQLRAGSFFPQPPQA
jgi:steroid 5-alpha reductase family enzyme